MTSYKSSHEQRYRVWEDWFTPDPVVLNVWPDPEILAHEPTMQLTPSRPSPIQAFPGYAVTPSTLKFNSYLATFGRKAAVLVFMLCYVNKGSLPCEGPDT